MQLVIFELTHLSQLHNLGKTVLFVFPQEHKNTTWNQQSAWKACSGNWTGDKIPLTST